MATEFERQLRRHLEAARASVPKSTTHARDIENIVAFDKLINMEPDDPIFKKQLTHHWPDGDVVSYIQFHPLVLALGQLESLVSRNSVSEDFLIDFAAAKSIVITEQMRNARRPPHMND